MKAYYKILFFLLIGTAALGQKTALDSVKIKQFKALNNLDGKYVLLVGTVYLDTKQSYQDSLYSLKNTVVISNGDKTLDVFHKEGFTDKQALIPIAEDYAMKGFSAFKIAKLTLDSSIVNLEIDEEADDKYTITLGAFDGVVPLQDLIKIMSIGGIRSVWDETIQRYTYIYGVYYSQAKAKQVMLQFIKAGLTANVLRYEIGLLSDISPSTVYSKEELNSFATSKDEHIVIDDKTVVFRVQVGTFNSKVPTDRFKGKDVLVFPFGKKLIKCFSGSFLTYKEAYKHKLELNQEGFQDSFIVAYRDGVNLSIGELVTKEEYDAIVAEFSSGN